MNKILHRIKNRSKPSPAERIELYVTTPWMMHHEDDEEVVYQTLIHNSQAFRYCNDDVLRAIQERVVVDIPGLISSYKSLTPSAQLLILEKHPTFIGHIRNPIEIIQLTIILKFEKTRFTIQAEKIANHLRHTNRAYDGMNSKIIGIVACGFNSGLYSYEYARELLTQRLEGTLTDHDIEQHMIINKLYMD